MSRQRIPKALQPLARRARKAGWTIAYDGGNHLRWTPPRGQWITTPASTHSSGHTVDNILRKFKGTELA